MNLMERIAEARQRPARWAQNAALVAAAVFVLVIVATSLRPPADDAALSWSVRGGSLAKAEAPGSADIAIAINTVLDGNRWERNYERIYKQWSMGIAPAPAVYWFSDGDLDRGTEPRIRAVHVAQWQERWVTQLGPLYRLAPPTTQWFILCDDDTYLFWDVVLEILSRFDASLPWYLGNTSEDVAIAEYLTRMAMGGGGAILSRPLVAALVGERDDEHDHTLANCLRRYANDFGGDKKLALCVGDVGGVFTRVDSFHQADVMGDYDGLLAYYFSRWPLGSLHHMYVSPPVYKGLWAAGDALAAAAFAPAVVDEFTRSRLPTGATPRTRDGGVSPAGGSFPDVNFPVLNAMDRLLASYRSLPQRRASSAPPVALSDPIAHGRGVGRPSFMSLVHAHLADDRLVAALNVGFTLRLWGPSSGNARVPSRHPPPASAFNKFVSGTFRAWEGSKIVSGANSSGIDIDVRTPDDPCDYARFEWVAPLQLPAVAAALPASLGHAVAELTRGGSGAADGLGPVEAAALYRRVPVGDPTFPVVANWPPVGCSSSHVPHADTILPSATTAIVLYRPCKRALSDAQKSALVHSRRRLRLLKPEGRDSTALACGLFAATPAEGGSNTSADCVHAIVLEALVCPDLPSLAQYPADWPVA